MNPDSYQSVYRERMLEHLLLGDLLRHSWLHHGASLEVSQPAVDRSGYDVLLEANGVTRHVQLKTSAQGAKTARQAVHLALADKPSGCIVWVMFDPRSLALGPFRFFGGRPNEPLPSLQHFNVARHTRGTKAQRPNLRVVPRAEFRDIQSITALYDALFVSNGRRTR